MKTKWYILISTLLFNILSTVFFLKETVVSYYVEIESHMMKEKIKSSNLNPFKVT